MNTGAVTLRGIASNNNQQHNVLSSPECEAGEAAATLRMQPGLGVTASLLFHERADVHIVVIKVYPFLRDFQDTTGHCVTPRDTKNQRVY
jgi:hypothetical protein